MTSGRTWCAKTGKLQHTRREAQRLAAWWRQERYAQMRHYRCRDCRWWHLRNARQGRKRVRR